MFKPRTNFQLSEDICGKLNETPVVFICLQAILNRRLTKWKSYLNTYYSIGPIEIFWEAVKKISFQHVAVNQ